MACRIVELRDKQVVSIKDGAVIGFVNDIEFDPQTGKITAMVITGRAKGLGLFSREEDIVIPWENIEVIGNDSILVNFECFIKSTKKQKNAFKSFFYGN